MLAVHFGAGNIGRGFIGNLLYESGYHTTFVDVNDKVIEALNDRKQYNVVLAAGNSETITVKNVSGINSVKNPEKVVDAIKEADIVTTAIGPNILPVISGLLAQGLRARLSANDSKLNIIACENMVGGSSLLKEKVYEHLSEEEKPFFDERFGFPDAAVDRIVPNQTNEDILQVSVEPYFEWVVEKTAMKGNIPEIVGITYVDDLKPYIERKLFTVNTGHAAAAYIGRYLGFETIDRAMQDARVERVIHGALQESGDALIETYNFDRQEHEQYIEKIIQRFKNPYISDEVTRVGRGPIRKLGKKDRLIRPAAMYMEATGKLPHYLPEVIAAVLQYRNPEDEEAVKLQTMIKEKGASAALRTVADLDDNSPLLKLVQEETANLTELK